MSYRKEKVLSLTGTEVNGLDRSALQEQCALHLNEKMHGVCFSPYEGDQEPGDPISEEQVRSPAENRTRIKRLGNAYSIH